MAFTKIKEEELVGKGVVGLPDRPSLSTLDMQKKFDELARDVIIPKFNGFLEELESSILDTIAEVEANEEEGKIAGALALKEYLQYVIKNFLPLTGGTLKGNLAINGDEWAILNLMNGVGRLYANSDHVELEAKKAVDDYNNRVRIYMSANNTKDSVLQSVITSDGVDNQYKIFGEHNKPSGSYTGNGSAETRIIDTGGIGNVAFLEGDGHGLIVTPHGAIAFIGASESMFKLNSSEIRFNVGVFTIASTHTSLNKSGAIYSYLIL